MNFKNGGTQRLHFALSSKRGNKNIKYIITSSGNRTYDLSRLQSTTSFNNILNTSLLLTVNDEKVSDGVKGCERAALIFKCSIEKAPQVCKIK